MGRPGVKLKLLLWRNAFWVAMVMLGFKLGTVRSGRRQRERKVEPIVPLSPKSPEERRLRGLPILLLRAPGQWLGEAQLSHCRQSRKERTGPLRRHGSCQWRKAWESFPKARTTLLLRSLRFQGNRATSGKRPQSRQIQGTRASSQPHSTGHAIDLPMLCKMETGRASQGAYEV